MGRPHANHPIEFTDPGKKFAFVIHREQPEVLEVILQDTDVGGLLDLMVYKIRCWRYAGSHCKYQFTAKANPQELAG